MTRQEMNTWWQQAITKERARVLLPSKPTKLTKPKKDAHAR